MKKILIAVCTATALSSITGVVFAENQGCPVNTQNNVHADIKQNNEQNKVNCKREISPEMKAKMTQMKEEFNKRLNLSPEQKEKMKAIHESSRQKMYPLMQSFKAERDKLQQLKDSNATKQNIEVQRDKVKELFKEIKTLRTANFEQIQTILNPEQQKEFNKFHEERKKMMKEKFQQKKELEKSNHNSMNHN